MTDELGPVKVVFGPDGKITEGGHEINETDFIFMIDELHEQLSCLSGRLYGLVDAMGWDEKQERAFKRLIKNEVWERFDDFSNCMKEFSRVGYNLPSRIVTGQPPDEL